MGWQFSAYTVALLLTMGVLSGLAFFAWRKRSHSGAKELCAILAMVGWWCGFYAIELASTDLSAELFLARVEYIGIVSIPVFWLVFVLSYTGRGAWLTTPRLAALGIIPLATLLLVWTNDYHGLFYTQVGQLDQGGLRLMDADHGPAFWFHTIYSYSLVAVATWLMIAFLVRRPSLYRAQAAALLTGTLAPWVANVVFLAGLSPFPDIDLTPLGFAVLGVAITYAIIGFRFLDLVPVAREKIMENMADGVIVLDDRARVVDLNPMALNIMGLPISQVIGKPIDELAAGHRQNLACCLDLREGRSEVLVERDGSCLYLDRQVSSFPIPGGGAGRLVVLRDITGRKLAEQAMARTYEELGIQAKKGIEDLAVASQTLSAEIQERERTQKALRESELRLVHFLDGLPLGVFAVDHSGEPLYENRAFQHLVGRSMKRLPDEELGGPPNSVLGAFIAGTDRLYPGERNPLVRALAGEGSSVTDMELRPSGSRVIPVEVTGAPIYDDKGEVQYALAIYRDISDRRIAEKKEMEYYRNLEFLSRTAIGFMGLPPEKDIYGSIAAGLSGLMEGSAAIIASYDASRGGLVVRAFAGLGDRLKGVEELFGGNLIGQTFRLDADQKSSLLTGYIMPWKGGLRTWAAEYLPENIATGLERIIDAEEVYSIGLATNEKLSGAAFMFRRKWTTAGNLEVIQTFINQSSVALQRWRAEEQVRTSLKEKEVLLREVHHRVKNNLQIVSSLLSLQACGGKAADGQNILTDAQNRIRSLALIHERLYASGDMSEVNMADYLGKLAAQLSSTYVRPPAKVVVSTDIENVRMNIDTAIPCGLLVNELVANSLKHAFPEDRSGQVTVRLRMLGGEGYELSVEDNGIGFPEGLDFAKTETLGCQLINNLAAQLDGTVELLRQGGTKFTIRFKEIIYEERG